MPESCRSGRCVEEAPDGWNGPIAVQEGDDLGSCGGAYDDDVLQGGTRVEADPAECSCTCTPAAGSGCAELLNVSVGASCDALDCTQALNASCVEFAPSCLAGLTTAYLASQLPDSSANCTASAQTPQLSAAVFATEALGCAPGDELERGDCRRDEVCAPEPEDGGALCVYRAGDRACPDGPYEDRRVYYTGIVDTRGCNDCQCSNDCGYTWTLYGLGDTACATPQLSLVGVEACIPVSPVDGKLRIGVEIDPCLASGGGPKGAAVADADSAVTVCCLPD